MPNSVLILDDDTDFNALLTDIFEQADYSVTSVKDPVEAIEAFAQNPSDLVVTDYKMPEMSGSDFMKKIKSIRPDAPVIMVSGFLENDTIRDLIGEGVGGVFLKPLNIFSLLERTSELIQETQEKPEPDEDRLDTELKEEALDVSKPGFTFRSYPCKSVVSSEFAERLHALRDFKATMSLIGPQGTHFRMICEDLRSFHSADEEAFVYLSPASLDKDELVSSIELAKQSGVKGITYVVLEVDRMTDLQKQLLVQLARREGDFEVIDQRVRLVFCVSQDLDELYDQEIIDESLYVMMGTTEVHVPSLHEVSADVPFIAQQIVAELVTERGLSTVPRFDKSARAFLRRYQWPGNREELYATLRQLFEINVADVCTVELLQEALRLHHVASPREQLCERLFNARAEYVSAVSILCDGDLQRVASILGLDTMMVESLRI